MRSWNILSVDLLTVAQGHYWYPHTSPTQIHTPWPAPCVGPKGGNCKWLRVASSVHFNSVTQSCSTLCDPMDCSTPGFPVHYQLQSLLKLMSIESVMPSNLLCRPLLFLPSIFPSIRVFSHESALCIRWPEYWSFSFSISPSYEYSGQISFRMDWLDLLAVQGILKSLLQ